MCATTGWPIGLGLAESACKSGGGARMKLAGMGWGKDGLDEVCPLRALFKSGADRWAARRQPSLN